jgi:hypothetical protein
MILALAGVKAFVAVFQERQNVVWSQPVALRLGQCISIGNAAEHPSTHERHRGDGAGGFEEAPTMEMVERLAGFVFRAHVRSPSSDIPQMNLEYLGTRALTIKPTQREPVVL